MKIALSPCQQVKSCLKTEEGPRNKAGRTQFPVLDTKCSKESQRRRTNTNTHTHTHTHTRRGRALSLIDEYILLSRPSTHTYSSLSLSFSKRHKSHLSLHHEQENRELLHSLPPPLPPLLLSSNYAHSNSQPTPPPPASGYATPPHIHTRAGSAG